MGPVGCHRKMILLNVRAWVVYAERPIFANMERISERTSAIRSKLNGGFGKDAVKGRDEREERALDTVLPKQTPFHVLFAAHGPKKEP
jgi:hypothetical protein